MVSDISQFDRVRHTGFLRKLKEFGISSRIIHFLQFSVQNRVMKFVMNDYACKSLSINCLSWRYPWTYIVFFLFSSMTARMSSGHGTLIILMTATYSRLSTKTNRLAKVKLLATLENYHLLVVNW